MIFIAGGYAPAMQMPVMTRNTGANRHEHTWRIDIRQVANGTEKRSDDEAQLDCNREPRLAGVAELPFL
jgi:hypothetical protein